MRKLWLLLLPVLFVGCASYLPHGAIYTSGTMGVQDTGKNTAKTGRACMKSVLGIVATGDASIAAAKANGGIREVATVDYEVENVLGIIGEYCTVVRGT